MSFAVSNVRLLRGFVTLVDSAEEDSQALLLATKARRGFLRPAERNDVEDEPPAKRRLSSAVVKETQVDGEGVSNDGNETHVSAGENGNPDQSDKKLDGGQHRGSWSQRDAEQRGIKKGYEAIALPEPAPRQLPKNEDPNLVKRNRRMLGNLLGTLERFRKEDKQLSGTYAYARRSAALQKAEQKAREESERLRLQERENLTEKRRRDLTLRARVAAKAEQKELELLFLRWCEQKKKLSNFIRLFLISVQSVHIHNLIEAKISFPSRACSCRCARP
uniref:Pinin/SDK/MemA protein domain-containing protein n=1 Tax=Brassica oleracea var. oleracea TaxID=109376 RepID=A0A0D3DX69_BRAOL